MAKGERLEIKCEGRFRELRVGLAEVVQLLKSDDPDYSVVTRRDLSTIFDLVETDLPRFDIRDPYYENKFDALRTDPVTLRKEGELRGVGLVPLLFRDVQMNRALVDTYARRFTDDDRLLDKLGLFFGDMAGNFEGVERLDLELGIDMGKVQLPGHEGDVRLAGYKLAAGFGIGKNAHGTLAYDAPFHIEVYKIDLAQPKLTERDPARSVLGIGFWLNPNKQMLVGQVQSMRGERLPEGSYMGVVGLGIAERVARAMGMKEVVTYSAQRHPILRMYPESSARFEADMRAYYNNSASKLGWEAITIPHAGNPTVIGYRRVLNGNGAHSSR
ncbi:MAG: hypothetical protein Q7S65_02270 [Nanoarchaeota archaeon]|nr:hypothetical protein [Nanoarchaeota archaeon]